MSEQEEFEDMVQIPENYQESDLQDWYEIVPKLKALKIQEMILRKRIYKHFFPNAEEGTNKYPLHNDWQLKANRKIDRSVDEAVYKSIKDKLEEIGVGEEIIRYKPELALKEYRKLSDKQRKVFDNCLIIKDGAPELELSIPKSKQKK